MLLCPAQNLWIGSIRSITRAIKIIWIVRAIRILRVKRDKRLKRDKIVYQGYQDGAKLFISANRIATAACDSIISTKPAMLCYAITSCECN
jgi:hypothetical protein